MYLDPSSDLLKKIYPDMIVCDKTDEGFEVASCHLTCDSHQT